MENNSGKIHVTDVKAMGEALRFLKYLSPKKIWNAGLLVSSFYISKILRKPFIWGLPLSISIEPTTSCNLRCPECPSGLRSFTRNRGNLKMSFLVQMIDQLQDHLVSLTFYFQGEPYINPNFLEMVKYAHVKKIYTISSTNGHFLDEENCVKTIQSGLDELIISVDGTTQESYEKYRYEGNLSKVIEGIKNLSRLKKQMHSATPKIVMQCLVFEHNEHQMDDMVLLSKELGADQIKFKSAQVYDYQNGNALIPKTKKYSRYIQDANGKFVTKHSIENECWKMWHSAVITWDGMVVPCCFDKDADFQMGDLKQEQFAKIWKNSSYQEFRTRLFHNRKEIKICENCTEGCRVWV